MTQDRDKKKGVRQPGPDGGSGSPQRSPVEQAPMGGPFVVLRHWGEIDPESIDSYLAKDGYRAWQRVVKEMKPGDVVDEVAKAKLRGRGGAGFPVAKKWEVAASANGGEKYVICNAYGADSSAAGDRALLERNPHLLIEGLAIAGFAVGAEQGFIYCQNNRPQAIERAKKAVKQAEDKGFIGYNASLGGMSFEISVVSAPVGFINGEETAILSVIEGQRAMPRQRPLYPAQSGLWGRPTVVNNAETIANLPPLIAGGAEAFAKVGSGRSGGTKLLTLQGRLAKLGLAEVPLGTPVGEVVNAVAGGPCDGAKLKAIQIGGPLGGVLPADQLDVALDFEALTEVGGTIGSGSVLALDDQTCMVDFARFRLGYLQNEACGRCIPGRLGTNRINGILEAIVSGLGKKGDLELLEELAAGMHDSSLCALCSLAAQPLLTSLKYFRDDYVAHIEEKRCPTGRCTPVRTEAFRRNKVLL